MTSPDPHDLAQAAMRAFDEAGQSPQWLDANLLYELDRLYPPEAGARTDDESRSNAGREKAERLLSAIKGNDAGLQDFLELGCGDGTVCETLAREGRRATGIDIDGDAFSNRARASGASFMKMDVAALEFRDASFDCICSFGSFARALRSLSVISDRKVQNSSSERCALIENCSRRSDTSAAPASESTERSLPGAA